MRRASQLRWGRRWETSTFSSTYIVKDVKPGDEVTVRVAGTRAKCKVPYKYKYQNIRVDGAPLDVETGVDGIFTGVQVINIAWKATDSSGTPKSLFKQADSDLISFQPSKWT